MPKQAKFVTRIEYEPENDKPGDGLMPAFDEIVTGPVDSVHIERMRDNSYWIGIYKGEQRQCVWLSSRGKLIARTENDS